MGMSLEQAVNSARGRLGAFRYNAALQISNAGHDSDIYFGMLDNPVPDYLFSAGPDIHVFLPVKKRVVFDISESPRYNFFLKTERERALNNAFAGTVHLIFDRVYIQAGGGLVNAKQRLSSELNVNIRLKENNVSGLVFWQASKTTSFALQCRRTRYNFENSTSEFANNSENLNRIENLVNLIGYLQQRSKARFYLDGEYGSYVFAADVSHLRKSKSYGVYAGVDFIPSAAGFEGQTSGIRGSAKIGYQYLDVLDPSQKDFSGLAGDIGVSLGIMKLTALRFFFSRGSQFSVYAGRTYYLETACGMGLRRSLTKHIVFTYDLGYSRNDYPAGEVSMVNPPEKSADKYLTHAFALNVRIRKDLEISLLADLGQRNSKLAPRPFSKHAFFGFSLTYGHSIGELSMPTGPRF